MDSRVRPLVCPAASHDPDNLRLLGAIHGSCGETVRSTSHPNGFKKGFLSELTGGVAWPPYSPLSAGCGACSSPLTLYAPDRTEDSVEGVWLLVRVVVLPGAIKGVL